MNTVWSSYIQSIHTLYDTRRLRFSDRYWPQYQPLFGLEGRSRLLEIGCGPGALAESLTRWYPDADVTGIDRDSAFVAFAQNAVPQARFLEGDAAALPFPDESFDGTISNTVVEHIEPSAFYGEQYRVLKPGGVCLVLSSRRGVNCPAPCVQEESDFERCIWERVTPFFDRVVQENAVGAYAQSESELPANMEHFGFREVSSRYVVLSLTPDDPACSPELARAIFEAGRSAALDNIDSLLQLPGQPVTSAEAEVGLTGLWFDGEKYFADTLDPEHKAQETPILRETKRWLDVYFRGQEPDFTPPLHPIGSPFRQEVWALLLQIPYGQTTTYGALAKQLAAMHGLPRMSAQAVGGAVGHNEISIIIPCHRVVGTNGSLTGYAGGIDKKAKLLTLEKIPMEHLFPPINYSLTPSTR